MDEDVIDNGWLMQDNYLGLEEDNDERVKK